VRLVRFALLSLLPALASALACGSQREQRLPRAKFPERLPQVVLPMRDPLDGPDPAVEATLEGPDGARATLWMAADSGASTCTIPTDLLDRLKLVPIRAAAVRSWGGPAAARVAWLPRLILGGLTVEQAQVAGLTLPSVAGDRGVLGNSVLDSAPWEISWDRGTVTLNATPWPEGGDVRSWPLSRRDGVDVIDVRINGFPTRMLLDTGASISTIPTNLAAGMGLGVGTTLTGELVAFAGRFSGAQAFVADLEIGSMKLDGQVFAATEAGERGVLGLNALASFEVQVLPGRRLLMRPRGQDLRATAATRVGRWAWMPSCASTGCVRARVEGSGGGGRVEVTFEAPLPRPVEVLFGCGQRREPEPPGALAARRLIGGTDPALHHLALQVNAPGTEPASYPAPDIDRQLLQPDGRPCRQLVVLDVAPLASTQLRPREGKLFAFR